MNFKKLLTLSAVFGLWLFAPGGGLYAQCTLPTSTFPSAAATAPVDVNVSQQISTCIYTNEKSRINNVQALGTYEISYTGGSANYVYVYDINGVVLDDGPTPLTFTSGFSGDIYVAPFFDASCNTESGCRTLNITFLGVSGLDAGVTTILGPSSGVCAAGNVSLDVVLTSAASDTVSTAILNWTVNGVPQAPVNYSGTIASTEFDTLSLGTITVSAGTRYSIKAWLSDVNGLGVDQNQANDTIQTVVGTGLSGIYTVDASQTTSGNTYSSLAEIFNDINYVGVCGPVTINVVANSGPYNEQVVINSFLGMGASNPIVVNGNHNTLKYLSTNSEDRATLFVNGGSHITIKKLTIEAEGSNTGEFGAAVLIFHPSEFVAFDSVEVRATQNSTSLNFAAFVCGGTSSNFSATGDGPSNVSLSNSLVEGGYYGVVFNGNATGSLAANNSLTNNEIRDFYVYATYFRGQEDLVADGNNIHRSNRTSVGSYYGFFLSGDQFGTSITNNRIHTPVNQNNASTSAFYGLYTSAAKGTAAKPVRFNNNLIYNVNATGIQYALYIIGATNEHISMNHNSISLDNMRATGTSAIRGLFISGAATNISFKNNILYIANNNLGTKYGIYLSSTAATLDSDYNLFAVETNNGTYHVGYRSSNQTTLANWQSVNNNAYDANSIFGNPLYVDMYGGDLTPTTTFAHQTATDLNTIAPTDFFGVNRPSNPDMGAIQFTPANCLRVMELTAVGQVTDALISFTELGSATEWEIEFGPVGFTRGSGTVVTGVNTNFEYNLTGLNPGQGYDYYVRAVCGTSDFSSWFGPGRFYTKCLVVAPFFENFDGSDWVSGTGTNNTGNQIDTCWTRDKNELGFYWGTRSGTTTASNTGPSGDRGGNGNYVFTASATGSSAGQNGMLNLPAMDISALMKPEMRFYYHMYGATMGNLYVEYLDGTEWMALDSIKGQQQTSSEDMWRVRVVDLSSISSDTIFVRFRGVRGSGTTGNMAIDDVSIDEAPPCADLSEISLSNILYSSVNIGWDADQAIDSVQIEWGPKGFSPGTGSAVYTSSGSYTLMGLAPGTCFDFYLTGYCLNGENGIVQGPFSFCTKCGPINTFPYYENFDGSSFTAGVPGETDKCWERIPESSGFRWYVGTGTTPTSPTGPDGDYTTGSGNYIFTEANNTATGDTAQFISPYFDVSVIPNPSLSFYYHMYGSHIEGLWVDVDENGAWRQVFEILGQQQTDNDDPWEKATVLLTGLSTDTVRFRFRVQRGSGVNGDVALDDFLIENAKCVLPTDFELLTLGSDTAQFGWNSFNTHFNMEWGPAGFTPGSGLGIDSVKNTTSPSTISNLQPSTVYDIYLADTCNPDGWVGPISFRTQCLSALSGTYTVGSAPGPNNFATLDSVVTSLKVCGVDGPVVFEIEGTHNYTFNLDEAILGADDVNTITFRGMNNGNTDTVKAASGAIAAVLLRNTGHFIFKNLTITNTSDRFVFHMNNGTHHIEIDSCVLIGDVTTTTAGTGVIVASNSETSSISTGDNVNHLSVTNNQIIGCYYGVSVYGPSTSNRNGNVKLENNTFTQQHYYGVRIQNMDTVDIVGNHISQLRNTTTYGFYFSNLDVFNISRNYTFSNTSGLHFLTAGSAGATHQNWIVNNKFVNANDPIYFSTARNINVYHNSTDGGSYGIRMIGTLEDLDIRNNIFKGDNNNAFHSTSTSVTNVTLDFNLYFNNGSTLARFGGTADEFASLSAWQTAQSQYNSNSAFGDPIYVSASDLTPVSFLANNSGDNSVGVNVDYFGNPRPGGSATNVDLGAVEFSPNDIDIEMLALYNPVNLQCGDSAVEVSVIIRNVGALPQTGFTVGADVSGSVMASLSTTYSTTIQPLVVDTFVVGSFNAAAGGTISILTYVDVLNDEDTSNDTVNVSLSLRSVVAPDIFALADTLCEGENALLWVENAFQNYWTNANNDTLAFGDTLAVNGLMASETFIAKAAQFGKDNVGPVSNSIGAGGNFANLGTYSLILDVKTPLTVDSVTVYPTISGGLLDIELKDLSNNVLQSVTVTVPALATAGDSVRVPVGITINAPGLYHFGGNGTNNAGGGLYRNTAGASFPYSSAGLDILGHTFSNQNYYYFWYNISYTSQTCGQPDVQKTIIVKQAINPVADFTFTPQFAPSTTVDFDASASQNADVYFWDFGDGNTNTTTSPTISHTYANGGNYSVTLMVENNECGDMDTLMLQVNSVSTENFDLNANINVYPNPTEDIFTISFDMPASDRVSVRIYSAVGKLVQSENLGMQSGHFNRTYNLEGKAKGVYMVEVVTSKGTATKRVLLH